MTSPGTEKGEYKAVTSMKDQDADEAEEKKQKDEPKLSIQQQLYKWARSGDSEKLRKFVRENRKDIVMKEFLSQQDDGSQDEEIDDAPSKKGCCGGDDENVRPKYKPYRSGNTALHFAALHGHKQFCKDLFEFEASFIDQKNKLGSTPLHLAAASGNPETLAFMLETYKSTSNENTNALQEQNKIGNTPLHCAVYSNNVECVKLILKKCEEEDIDPREALSQTNHIQVATVRYAATPEMKRYLNIAWNPDLAEEEEAKENDKAPNYGNDNSGNAQSAANGVNSVVEVEEDN